MTTTQTASPKQISYIVSLCNQITGRRDSHLSQVRNVREVGLSASKASRGISKAEASAIIDALVERIG